MAFETLETRSAEAVNELHWVGENDQPISAEATRKRVLKSRSVLVLVCNDNWIPLTIRLVQSGETLKERPEQRPEVVEDKATRLILFPNYYEEPLEFVSWRGPAVPELGEGVLGKRLEESFAPLDLAHKRVIHPRKGLFAASAAADHDLKRQPKCPAICAYTVPEEAVIVCDLHPRAQFRQQLAGGLALKLRSGLSRECKEEDTRIALKTRCNDAAKPNGEMGLSSSRRRHDELVSLRRGADGVVLKIGSDIRHRPW